MAVGSETSPYPLGTPVTDPRLLQNRRREITDALDAVAADQVGDSRHAVVLGEQRSGRSTVLLEVARRAAADRGRLVVLLRGNDEFPCERHGLTRQLLTATVEALADAASASRADWYLAWRDRVYLRDRTSASARDVLSSALFYAADADADIDRAVLERDLAALRGLAVDAGMHGIVVCLDDASTVTEDVRLVEEILSAFDAVGGYSLLMAGLPATAKHFVQAASPCLARFVPIWLRPFRGPHQVFTSLSAPLTDAARSRVHVDDAAFLRDVLRLTGGNPYEVMLVGHHLWLTCERGEQDRYVLTPRVLDSVIPHLALLAAGGDALRDGAEAIDRLAEEHVRQAVELVAMSRLTIRQIAIARILKIESRDADRVDRAILTADVTEETTRVLAELEELEEAGVIQLHADGERFSVVGGQAASVLLKYKARARIGADASSQPFELNFLFAVGRAVARDAAVRTVEALEGSSSLGFTAVMSQGGSGRLSPRPAIRNLSASGEIGRLVEAEIDLVSWTTRQYERIAELLAEDDPHIALVYTALMQGRELLEYTELWELTADVSHEDLTRVWSDVAEEWEPVAAGADLNWTGSEFAVLSGETARHALIVLQRFAAGLAVQQLFGRWYKDRDEEALERAHHIGDRAVAAMRATGLSEWELGGELSGMLSRLGFLKSFDDSLLGDARQALEDALQTGNADDWVTHWNLANVAARQEDRAEALTRLEQVAADVKGWRGSAFVLMFVPHRPAAESLVSVTDVGIEALLELQVAVIGAAQGEETGLAEALQRCKASKDEGTAQAAKWVAEALVVES